MKLPFTPSALLVTAFSLALSACSVQDHLRPETEKCRISTFSVTTKSTDLPYGSYDEILEMDGNQTKFEYVSNRDYSFDEEGRVIKVTGFASRSAIAETYQYLPEVFKVINWDKTETTFPRNEQGYQVRPGYVYNSEGYLIQTETSGELRKYTYVGGNLVKEELFNNSSATPKSVTVYEYDLSKPNLPDESTFTGKKSRNLPTKMTITEFPSISSRTLAFSYLFDEKGQVKRRISIFVTDSSRSPYQLDDYLYTFTCQ
ncbi:hypothetical protein [Larkinella terrae]|uniref:DUF4595 domain-containing protein n=1 Tax=Larkinella terrae TaxID=2025311 RepID=A0A7K0EK65_9BACT|nr:hypothetical protein [Larkinella terrae]MRS62122.1 hypothetical protein [Larkinella terrae]